MNAKKLVLFGAIALVVFGCVIAAGCTSQETGADAPTEPIVGQWTTDYLQDGTAVDAVLTLRADGEGYWMLLGEELGIRITYLTEETWKKTGENTYLISSGNGNSYETVYDPVKDTITTSGSRNGPTTYTRLDPIVGIWSGVSSAATGNGDATTIIRKDGTGVLAIADADTGAVEISSLSWTKNADGTYDVLSSNGIRRTYAVDAAGKTLTTEDGRTKTKEFLDSSFLVSVTGLWYNKDKERAMVFNADGTGYRNDRMGVSPFTWKMGEAGKFTVAYVDGTDEDGSSLKGKTAGWTYDRENDAIIPPSGMKYTHPTGSIEGMIALI